MPQDPWLRLAQARRDYVAALVAKRELQPGQPGYREAVHRVGITFNAVKVWERRALATRKEPPEGPGR